MKRIDFCLKVEREKLQPNQNNVTKKTKQLISSLILSLSAVAGGEVAWSPRRAGLVVVEEKKKTPESEENPKFPFFSLPLSPLFQLFPKKKKHAALPVPPRQRGREEGGPG